MLKLKKLSQTYGIKAYTEAGDFFGEVDEALLEDNKVYGWKIKAAKDSILAKMAEGLKGVIVPHQLVKAIGDIMIVSRASVKPLEEKEE